MSETTLRRSQLATPASSPKMMRGAAESGADAVFLDLEDAVAPDEKAAARDTLIEAAIEHDWSDTLLSYRINGLDTRWWYEDVIDVIAGAGHVIDTIIVPKVRTPADVRTVERLLTGVETNSDSDGIEIGIDVLIEDGTGMHHAYAIAHASDRVRSLTLGPGDYAAAIGAPGLDIGQFPDYPGHYWHYALSHLNAAAGSAELLCIDGPYADYSDHDGLHQASERARLLGCDGKWAIHPDQIPVINDVFSPDPAVAERAQRIVEAYAEATAAGEGAVTVDGQMVDEATNRMAAEIVAKAQAADVL